jgi:catechol 2,3-dioxygenase-like lactoylglutathione lyase family enzyme
MKKFLIILLAGFTFITCLKAQSNFSSPLIGVGVVVSNLDKSVDFYTNIIGMVKTGGFSLDADFTKRSGLSGGVPFSVVVLKLEDSDKANEWKLMSFGNNPVRKKSNYVQDDLGMQYITIHVKALDPIIKRLKEKGIAFLGNTPTPLSENRFFLLVQDPDGNFIELIGPK